MVADRGWLGWWSVAVEAGDSSCFLFPSAEALLLLLVSFVPSVNAVLPSLQQLYGVVGNGWDEDGELSLVSGNVLLLLSSSE